MIYFHQTKIGPENITQITRDMVSEKRISIKLKRK